MYALEFKTSVFKDFARIPTEDQKRIWQKMQSLKSTPRPSDCRKLIGRKSDFRLRQGNYRIIYQVLDDQQKIVIIRVEHRKDIYR